MTSNYTDDFFRDVYNAELEQKSKLDSLDGLLIGILTALSAVAIYYARTLSSCGWHFAGVVFFLLTIVFLHSRPRSLLLSCLFWPRTKEYIAPPDEWGEFVAGLRDYYRAYFDEEETEERIAIDLAKTLRQKYMEADALNRRFNIKKASFQTWVRRCITVAVLAVLVNAIPTFFIEFQKSTVQKVEVVNSGPQKVEIVSPQP